MRQRTRIGEPFWRVSWPHNGNEAHEDHESRPEAAAHWGRLEHCGYVAKIHRVTRYRLAALIELPAWEHAAGPDEFIIRRGPGPNNIFARFCLLGVPGVSDGWAITIGCRMFDERHPTADAARVACEERLRELGFRVARAKAGAK